MLISSCRGSLCGYRRRKRGELPHPVFSHDIGAPAQDRQIQLEALRGCHHHLIPLDGHAWRCSGEHDDRIGDQVVGRPVKIRQVAGVDERLVDGRLVWKG